MSAAKKNAALHLVWGSNEFEVGRKARELVDAACPPADQAFGLEAVECRAATVDDAVKAVSTSLLALRTIGFFGGGRTIWMRDASFLSPDREPGDSETVKERLEDLTAEIKKGLPEGQTLIISADKVHRATAFYKACAAAGEVHDFNPPEKGFQAQQATQAYVQEIFAQAGLQPDAGALEAFRLRCSDDGRQIHNEIEKLALYVGERKRVTADDVRAIVSSTRESMAWDISDQFGQRNLVGALAIMRQLIEQRESPHGLIVMIEGRIRDLLIHRQCIDRRWLTVKQGRDRVFTDWQPSTEADAWLGALGKDPRSANPFRTSILAGQALKYSLEELLQAHRLITEAHEKMVSSGVPAEILLEHALISIMRQGPRHAA